MKIYAAILSMILCLFIATNSQAEVTILAYDTNGDKAVTQEEVFAGQDKFLVRLANSAEASSQTANLLKVQNQSYVPVSIDELLQLDTDKNHALTSQELHRLGIRLAIYQPGDLQYAISTLEDNGISYLRVLSSDTETQVRLVPGIGGTPIKLYSVKIDKLQKE